MYINFLSTEIRGRKMTATKNKTTKILMILFAFVIMFSVCFSVTTPLEVNAAELIIVLDPGHGGSDPGAQNTVDGKLYQERNLNLKIAQNFTSFH